MSQKRVVIIGNGIAGITAARHIRKLADYEITVISAESEYFFARTALMYVFMGHMRFEDTQPYEPYFWKKNRIQLIHDYVEQIDFIDHTLQLQKGEKLGFDKLILAVGSKPHTLNWPGSELKGVQGLYTKQDLDLLTEQVNHINNYAVVVGGGLIGIELVEMLIARNKRVKLLVRENHFWGNVLPENDAEFVEKHLAKHTHLTILKNTELTAIQGGENGRVSSVQTNTGQTITCDFVGLTIGVTPNVEFLKGTSLALDRGILVNEFLETNMADVYAIGDCAQFSQSLGDRGEIEQVWYTGRMMGETVAQSVCGNRMSYSPGIWYNSAKFFDLEYQTYGRVWNKLGADEAEFSWTDPKRERRLHFVFDKTHHQLLGVNTFGIRLRHEVLNHWIAKHSTIEDVLVQFQLANFDPEFYKAVEKDVLLAFNSQFGTNLKATQKKWWQSIYQST